VHLNPVFNFGQLIYVALVKLKSAVWISTWTRNKPIHILYKNSNFSMAECFLEKSRCSVEQGIKYKTVSEIPLLSYI